MPLTAAGFRICPLCERRQANVMLYRAVVCEGCRTEYITRRLSAFAVDVLLVGLVAVAICLLLPSNPLPALPLSAALFLLKDALDGRSPGKRLFGLQVIEEPTRRPAGMWATAIRNAIFLVPGLILIEPLIMTTGERLGDRISGTMVSWRRYARSYPFSLPGRICGECGYNLKGNRSGRCPECGREILGGHYATR